MQHIASDNDRLSFLEKSIEIIKNHTSNSIDPPKQFALDFLISFEPPTALGNNENNFYGTINTLAANLTTAEEKIKVFSVIFKYLHILQPNRVNKFYNVLTSFINTHDAVHSKSLIKSIRASGNHIPETLWNTLRTRSKAFNDLELMDNVFKHYLKQKNESEKYFSEVLNINLSLAVSLFLNNASELSEDQVGNIIILLLQQSRSNIDQLPQIFKAIIQTCEFTKQEYRDMFGDRLLELIRDISKPYEQEIGLEYLNLVKDKISPTKKQDIALTFPLKTSPL